MSENIDNIKALLDDAVETMRKSVLRDARIVERKHYAQVESLSWLQRRLTIKGQLPPLRGWAASPDVLLLLHTHIGTSRPQVIVEFGSGASTLVIADALRQNGTGRLISVEHSHYYASQVQKMLQGEDLEEYVDLRVGDLENWDSEHFNSGDAEKPPRWYPASLLEGVDAVDLVWVDGPPGATCAFSRYPALPALADQLSADAEVWMDDTIRDEETKICDKWAKDYGFEVEYYALEKGLGRLKRPGR